MKKILILIALLVSALSSYAQGSWGIRAAFDINIPGNVGGIPNIPGVDNKIFKEMYRRVMAAQSGWSTTIGSATFSSFNRVFPSFMTLIHIRISLLAKMSTRGRMTLLFIK